MVSAIIVTARLNNYLEGCLNSLKAQALPDLEIILIDNSLPENKGLAYAAALNKGIGMSRGDFILCLNDDVTLEKYFISEALKGFSISDKVGMVSGKVLRMDKVTIDTTGLFLTCWRTAKERGYNQQDKKQFENPGYIFGVNGAVAFYRRKMLEELKVAGEYFDADFGFFYEDLDISWRAQRKGWQGYYVPEAVACHVRGASVRSQEGINRPYALRFLNDDLLFDLIKNRYLTIIKNESIIGFVIFLPFMFGYNLLLWGFVLIFRPRVIKKFILEQGYYFSMAFKKRKLISSALAAPCAPRRR